MKTIARKRSALAILAGRISLTPIASPARTFSWVWQPLSLTPCFSWVWQRRQTRNRFNGLPHTVETVETVPARLDPCSTQLKQGVNERGSDLRPWVFEVFGLAALLAALTTAALAADPPLQQVTDPRAILQDLQHKMSSLGSVCLDFTQERNLKLFTEPLRSEGVMLIERPDQIRWETTAPYQSILLGNHKSVAQFERTDGEWKKLKLGFPQMLRRVMEQMAKMHQGQLDALTSDYTISVTTGSVAGGDARAQGRNDSLDAIVARNKNAAGLYGDARSCDERTQRRVDAHHLSPGTARGEVPARHVRSSQTFGHRRG